MCAETAARMQLPSVDSAECRIRSGCTHTGPVQSCALLVLLPLVIIKLVRFLFSNYQPPCRFDIKSMFLFGVHTVCPCRKKTAAFQYTWKKFLT